MWLLSDVVFTEICNICVTMKCVGDSERSGKERHFKGVPISAHAYAQMGKCVIRIRGGLGPTAY